jgi:tRNA A37 threonylcarbamoyladenosine modification protein TsaB
LTPEEAGRRIAELARQEKTLVTGDALERYGELLRDMVPDEVVFLPEAKWMPSPAVIAAIGLRLIGQGRTLDLAASEPLYLRRSEAERGLKGSGAS